MARPHTVIGQLHRIMEATLRTRFFRARSMLREGLSQDRDMAVGDAFNFAGERCNRIVLSVKALLPGRPQDA